MQKSKLQIKCGTLELKNMYKSVFSLIVCLLLLSCRTPPRGSFAGATIIGGDSDIFLFVPIQDNKELLTKILPEHKYVKKALDKTNFLYLSLTVKNRDVFNKEVVEERIEKEAIVEEENVEEVTTEIPNDESVIENDEEENIFNMLSYDLCAIGSYPTKLLQFFLTKKNGWTRKKLDGGYTYYQKENEVAKSFSFFSIPTKELALFSHNTDDEDKMEEVLERVDKPRPVYFDEEFEMAIQQGNPSNDICIFVSNAHFFLSKLLGIDLDLPIETLKVYLSKDVSRTKEIYTYSIILEVKNLTAGFATRLLLSKLLKTQVKVDGNKIVVEKAKVTTEKLVDIIRKVVYK